MSTHNHFFDSHWGALVAFCLEHGLRFVPGIEPWFSYEAIGRFTGQNAATIEKKCRKLRKHTMFPGFIKCTDMEKLNEEEEP